MVPFDTRSPMITSGVRVGTPALTSRGVKQAQAAQVVDWIDRIIMQPDNEAEIAAVRREIHTAMAQYPLFAW